MSLNIFFFSFLTAPWHVEFLGQGSDLSHRGALHCSCGNTGSLIHFVGGLGSNLHPSAAEMLSTPLCHSRNSYMLFKSMSFKGVCVCGGGVLFKGLCGMGVRDHSSLCPGEHPVVCLLSLGCTCTVSIFESLRDVSLGFSTSFPVASAPVTPFLCCTVTLQGRHVCATPKECGSVLSDKKALALTLLAPRSWPSGLQRD